MFTGEIDAYILSHIDEEGDLLSALNRDANVNLLRPRMLSGHLQGRILKMFCRMIRPRRVLEIGTYTSYATLCMAEGMEEGALIHTIEINDEMEDFIMKPVYPAARALPTYENLLLEMVEPNILKVTLNRPKAYNALSHDLVRELTELSQWLVDEYYNIRVVLLYGGDEGKGFCAGLDVKQGLTDYEQTVPGFYHYQIKLGELEWFIAKTPQPWITLIDNVSAGGGFSLAMCSDIRVCTKTARFSCFYANVGIGGCDMSSSYFLPRLIGTGRAYEMMLTGNFINADEAWNLGLVSKVVDERKDLVPAGLELARVIAAKDPMAVRLTKEAMRANVDASGFDNALQVENRNQTLMIAHNVNKDASQDPIGKYWIEDRTDPMNPKGAN